MATVRQTFVRQSFDVRPSCEVSDWFFIELSVELHVYECSLANLIAKVDVEDRMEAYLATKSLVLRTATLLIMLS